VHPGSPRPPLLSRPGCDGVERLGQAAQARADGCEALHPAHHIGHGPTEAVQAQNDHDVTRTQANKQAAQCGLPAALLRTGLLLNHDLFASCLDQRPVLCAVIGGVIAARPEVADQHGTAPFEAAGFGRAPPRRRVGQGRALRLAGTPMPDPLKRETTLDGIRFPCISFSCETPADKAKCQRYTPCVKPNKTMASFKTLPPVQLWLSALLGALPVLVAWVRDRPRAKRGQARCRLRHCSQQGRVTDRSTFVAICKTLSSSVGFDPTLGIMSCDDASARDGRRRTGEGASVEQCIATSRDRRRSPPDRLLPRVNRSPRPFRARARCAARGGGAARAIGGCGWPDCGIP